MGIDAEGAAEIYAILRNQIGHDFSGYKTKTFLRRVQRRMQVTQLDTIEAYVERLRQEPHEVDALFRDLLINVTNFFRDADAFEAWRDLVIPKLFEGRGADDTVRVWVPGCATGEEVFSIAMLLREQMDRLTAVPRVQIFATDIDERALAVARAGPLSGSAAGKCLAGASRALLHRRRRQLCRQQGCPRTLHLLAAQRDPRSAVLAASTWCPAATC